MNFSEFIDFIGDYESDTFSASAERLTNEEKIKMANKILETIQIDGVLLSIILDEVRQ